MPKTKKSPTGQTSIYLDAQGLKDLKELEDRVGGFNRSDAVRKWLGIAVKRIKEEEEGVAGVVLSPTPPHVDRLRPGHAD